VAYLIQPSPEVLDVDYSVTNSCLLCKQLDEVLELASPEALPWSLGLLVNQPLPDIQQDEGTTLPPTSPILPHTKNP